MKVVAQSGKMLGEARFILALLESGQYPTIVGAVTAIVEQRNIPVRAQRLQKFQQRAGRFREFEAEETLTQRPGRSTAYHIAHMQLGHLVIREIDDLIATCR